MNKVKLVKLSTEQIKNLDVKNWQVWEKEVSRFDWEYDQEEDCFIIEGEIIVETPHEKVRIQPGDFVTFEKGLKCTWDIKQPVKKHYRFNE